MMVLLAAVLAVELTDGTGVVRKLAEGDTIGLDRLAPGRWSVRATGNLASARFDVGGNRRVVSQPPYELNLWDLALGRGRHRLTITPFPAAEGSGIAGKPFSVTLEAATKFNGRLLLWDAGPPPGSRRLTDWRMHELNNPNEPPRSLDIADVNGDGLPDLLVAYRTLGALMALHPGVAAARRPWPSVVVSGLQNASSAVFGDFDGDRRIDVAISHGAGLRIAWGPSPELVNIPRAWAIGADLPGAHARIESVDANADGAIDILADGVFLDAPADAAGRRDLANWGRRKIDPGGTRSVRFADLDADGDRDMVAIDGAGEVRWYRNPGPQTAEWPRQAAGRGSGFALGDLDGDGRVEVLVHADREISIFRSPGSTPQCVTIPKDPIAQWRSGPIELADLNGDGRLDILGLLAHDQGRLPREKAAVYWMESGGGDRWTTHPIKWGDGFIGAGSSRGERWADAFVQDIDRDGDLDVVALCEDYAEGDTYIAVVWFENPLKTRR
jgi:hypothetical protein